MRGRRLVIIIANLTICFLIPGCSGSHLIVREDKSLDLCRCIPLPNCVSSTGNPFLFYNHVAPFRLAVPDEKAWPVVREVVQELPRTTIVEEKPGYIHAKCRSLVFRFVDDLELLQDPNKKDIQVRSSAELGILDFGVNYLRVRKIREALHEKGIIE